MPTGNSDAQSTWLRLKPDTEYAVAQLNSLLQQPDESSQNLIDAYLFAKRALADSMQALLRTQIPRTCETFREMRSGLERTLTRLYGDRIPEQYLKVPYGSRTHEELFSILLERQGQPVEGVLLRIITADKVHAERRTRELRELGLDIRATRSQGADVYTLHSLDLDPEKLPSIVANLIRGDKSLTKYEQEELQARL
ncbi:hypothetical protein ACEZDB_05540 [Streptacidiphilus sp. N1-3]|uniref:Uncharacterized protein n=1 Tax=Streptacidiphilus alkalitolerans TaxID=3342712 RepID=A0ABV6WVZ1_9ACTN